MWRRRRRALNEALHELRRPLQALVLAGSLDSTAGGAGIENSVRLAAGALERLDREINGGAPAGAVEWFLLAPLLASAVQRWQRRAELNQSSLILQAELDGEQDAAVVGDRWAIAQALDNLVVNAIEHGGPRIVVTVAAADGRLRVSVRDCGRPLPMPAAGREAARWGRAAPIRDRARSGHGLRIVSRVASAHGGAFSLERRPGGAEAVLELPAR